MSSGVVAVRGLIVLALAAAWVGWEASRLKLDRSAERARVASASATDESVAGVKCLNEQRPRISFGSAPSFIDVSHSWGLQFEHAVGPLGTYFMPESVGTGGAFFDYDNDGRLDLFLVQSGRTPGADGTFPEGLQRACRLFHQTENGTFEDLTTTSGLAGYGYGVGCAVGDIDNDGDPDLYVTRYEQDSLYRNNGDGTFTDITELAGIQEKDWGTCAAFFDYDRDGWLDLVVINYTEDPTYGHSVGCGFQKGLVSYCGPHKFLPTVDRLFHNDGMTAGTDGRSVSKFTDVTEAAGLTQAKTFGFGVVCADFSDDGWPDIFVANDGAPNRLWVNQHDGTFLEEAFQRGCAIGNGGTAEAGMGISFGDVNHDARFDVIISHLSGEKATLYLAKEDNSFEDSSRDAGMVVPTSYHTGWGTGLVDLNHDGELDFILANGLVIPCHSKFPPHGEDKFQVRHDVIPDPKAFWLDYADQNVLLLGQGNGKFMDATESSGDFGASIGSARALIYGDIDNDGDIDIVTTNCGGAAKLYRNDFSKTGNWLIIRAYDSEKNRDALGAEIMIRTNEKIFKSQVSSASSFLASNDVRVHFGLGTAETVDEITIKWPDGPVEQSTEVFQGGPVRQILTLRRGTGRLIRREP